MSKDETEETMPGASDAQDGEASGSGDEGGAEDVAAQGASPTEGEASQQETADDDASSQGPEEDPLESARAEAAENYDRFLRATAELDNYRKRTAKVRSESREEALRDILLQVAPILDNIHRALAQDSSDVDSFKEGVALINNQFQEALKGYGLEEIEAVGQPFDPTLHEALLEVEHPEHPPGTVVEEMEKGYKLNNKVVRPTRVIVSKAVSETGDDA